MNLLSISQLSREDIISLIDSASRMKREKVGKLLQDKILAMIFEYPSTRTKVSFHSAMKQLGGSVISLSWDELQLSRGEEIEDTALVLSRYVDGLLIRSRHSILEEFAKHSSIPVINGLSEVEHPCQVLSDFLTIKEKKGLRAKIAWIGDGNNVCNSLLLGCGILGMEVRVASPQGYEPKEEIVRKARTLGGKIEICNEPREAAEGADVLYTDVWVSLGQEGEREERELAFKKFRIDEELVSLGRNPIVMHCLPAYRGKEITPEVLYGKNSVVFEQAENRLHLQKALLAKFLK
jgi:ornithine carbamoyltransferase